MGRRESNKAEKQRRLLAAGLAAFRKDGYQAASVETIAADADVARGTFYLYFRNKEALFFEVMAGLFVPLLETVQTARDMLAACPDGPATLPVYNQLGVNLAVIVAEHADTLRLCFAEARGAGAGGEIIRAELGRVERLVEEILEDAVGRGILRPHDCRSVAIAIVGGIEALTWHFLQGGLPVDPQRLSAELTRLFRHGLAPG